MDKKPSLTGPAPSLASELRSRLGDIDIYVLDQVMRGRVTRGMRVLDAGCGGGRNIAMLMREGLDVCGVDSSETAIQQVKALAADLAPELPADNLRCEPVERLSFGDASFDAVVAVAVLHFAADDAHFRTMLGEMWRVLKPGGVFFARLASSIGLENAIKPLGGRRYRLPDGSDRFLVDEAMLLAVSSEIGGDLIDPIKTVNVQGLRCMTNWTLRKMT